MIGALSGALGELGGALGGALGVLDGALGALGGALGAVGGSFEAHRWRIGTRGRASWSPVYTYGDNCRPSAPPTDPNVSSISYQHGENPIFSLRSIIVPWPRVGHVCWGKKTMSVRGKTMSVREKMAWGHRVHLVMVLKCHYPCFHHGSMLKVVTYVRTTPADHQNHVFNITGTTQSF